MRACHVSCSPLSFRAYMLRVETCTIKRLHGATQQEDPFLRNTLNGRSIRMLLNLCRTSRSYFPTKCNSTSKVPISFFSLLTDDQLINLPGIFCEINIRSPCSVRGQSLQGPSLDPPHLLPPPQRHPVQAMPKHHLQQHKVANLPSITRQVNHLQTDAVTEEATAEVRGRRPYAP